ncbi:MAG: aldehyde dehydrogenase [Bacteroidales bacterium]
MELNKVFTAQQEFFNAQQTKEIAFRRETLLKLKNCLQQNEAKIYEAIYSDFRKSAFDVYTSELAVVYREINYFLKNLNRLSKPRKVKTSIENQLGKSRVYYEGLGNILIIGAWNYPYALTLIPMIDAIAAGNTCIVKPSELAENTMRLIADIINTNFPSNYLYVVQGGVAQTSELLKLSFNKIFFTGSTKVGKIVYEAAAKNLTPVTLELGGKSPVIVTKEANLKVAVKRIVWGKFLNSGQTCVAPDYVLVESSIKEEFVKLLREQIASSRYEDGAEHYVSIINERNFDRVLGLIDTSKLVYGGASNRDTLYIEPTLLDNVQWEDAIMQEEIFAPILPILSFDNFTDILHKLQQLEKPLAAYLFTQSKTQKREFLQTLSFGGGCINDTVMHLTSTSMPFGGVGNSGIGCYHGESGFMNFSHQKSVLDRATWGEFNFKYPPYSSKKLKAVKMVLK